MGSAIAGGIVGITELTVVYPFEFTKTKQQLMPILKHHASEGTWQNMKHTYRNYGMIGFYRGWTTLAFFSGPAHALKFGIFELLQNHVFKGSSLHSTLLSGFFTGIIESLLLVTPVETIKTQLIHDRLLPKPQYHGLMKGTFQIIQKEKFIGLYKGLAPTLIRQGLNQAVRFGTYGEVKHTLNENFKFMPDILNKVIAGASAGALSVFIDSPFDFLKSRMQGLEAHKYKGMLDCAQKVMKEEGFFAFYRGLPSRILGEMLHIGLCFTIFDIVSEQIQKLFTQKNHNTGHHDHHHHHHKNDSNALKNQLVL